jgi:RNA polymerase sigma factor (sigma-70 family)
MPVGEGESGELIDLIEDENAISPAAEVSSFLQHEHISSLLDKMDEREREILSLRFGLYDGISRTLAETAKHFGLTRERVRQIESAAMEKLKMLMSPMENKEK